MKRFHSLRSEFHSILTPVERKFTTQRVESRPVQSIFTPKEVITDATTQGVKMEWKFTLYFFKESNKQPTPTAFTSASASASLSLRIRHRGCCCFWWWWWWWQSPELFPPLSGKPNRVNYRSIIRTVNYPPTCASPKHCCAGSSLLSHPISPSPDKKQAVWGWKVFGSWRGK